jgi:multidrug efflux pump subunit AcrB
MSYNPPPQPPQNQPPGQPQYGPPQGPPQGQPPQQYQPQGQPPTMPPPPPGYNYGQQGQGVPAQVNTAAILLFVMGGFAILGGLLLFLISGLGAIFAVLAVIYLALGGVSIWVGVAVRQLKAWARTAAITIAAIVGVLALLSLVKGGFTSIITLVMAAVIIYMLMQKPVVEAFNRSGR